MTSVKKTGSDKPSAAPVEKVITSQLFEDYLNCPTKCFLRASHERGIANVYTNWYEAQTTLYCSAATDKLITDFSSNEVVRDLTVSKPLKNPLWRLAVNLSAHAQNLEANIHAVEQKPPSSSDMVAHFIPIRFNFKNKLTRNDKLVLAFDALVLSKTLGSRLDIGKTIHGDDHITTKVDTTKLTREVKKIVGKIEGIVSAVVPPKLVLNKHCAECLFQERCHKIATEKNDLSLLNSISENEISKLNNKGIFSVTQLSYTFRPRRRSKRHADRPEKYHHALKALAIRERKIHIVGSPQLKIEGTLVFFDVEGLPDRDFYYLIGVRIITLKGVKQHSLWADDKIQEKQIWDDFIKILNGIETPVLIHYGSFETTFLKKMRERYGEPPEDFSAAKAIKSSVNLLSVIYARVYFSTYSNGLKDIASYLDFKWNDSSASGLQSIVWRHEWEHSGDPTLKDKLIRYNADDCEALDVVAQNVQKYDFTIVNATGVSSSELVRVDMCAKDSVYKWKVFKSPIDGLETINKAAHWDYQRDRIYVRSGPKPKAVQITCSENNKESRANEDTVIMWPVPPHCPQCNKRGRRKDAVLYRTVHDIIYGRDSIKRRVIKYTFQTYKCRSCNQTYGFDKRFGHAHHKYGWGLLAYFVYNIIELCTPQHTVMHGLNRLLSFDFLRCNMTHLKSRAATYYTETRNNILDRILRGGLLQADETRANIQGKLAYVWVLTNLHEVVYILTENREGDFIQDLLTNFKGVLISDFYAAYDAIPCPQQKCLIHLIRDLNDAVLESPFDEELKDIVVAFSGLLQPIVATIDRRGLKKYWLHKHKKIVGRFFAKLDRTKPRSEAAQKAKQKFFKNRDRLFTFLDYDNVPWHNNNAEYAIKAFALLRKIISGTSTKKRIEEYLILLSVCRTCEYQKIDFLNFLRSGEKDIAAYAAKRRRRSRKRQDDTVVSRDGSVTIPQSPSANVAPIL